MAGVFLTIPEVAGQLRVAQNTVRNEIKAGRLAAFRVRGAYRVRPEDLAAYVEGCRVESDGRAATTPPARRATTLKHLDGVKLLDTWTRRGVPVPPPGGGSARSFSSNGALSTGATSSCRLPIDVPDYHGD